MTPINEVPVGKFCKLVNQVVYVCKNNFTDVYTLVPIDGIVPSDRKWDVKVYVYKRLPKWWVERATGWVEFEYKEDRIDNLTYIENLAILKSYGI